MKIEAGKFYRTRDGRKVGPMERWSAGWVQRGASVDNPCWHGDGRDWSHPADPGNTLIADWADEPASPVRTVTRKEILVGVYGAVAVGPAAPAFVNVLVGNGRLDRVSHVNYAALNESELRAAAMVFTQLADALNG